MPPSFPLSPVPYSGSSPKVPHPPSSCRSLGSDNPPATPATATHRADSPASKLRKQSLPWELGLLQPMGKHDQGLRRSTEGCSGLRRLGEGSLISCLHKFLPPGWGKGSREWANAAPVLGPTTRQIGSTDLSQESPVPSLKQCPTSHTSTSTLLSQTHFSHPENRREAFFQHQLREVGYTGLCMGFVFTNPNATSTAHCMTRDSSEPLLSFPICKMEALDSCVFSSELVVP